MILYHLDKWKYREVWPPEGTLHAGGRWNKPGQWIIYASTVVSLTKLEILANESMIPVKRVCMTISVEDPEVMEVLISDLPINWMEVPYPKGLLLLTTEFLKSKKLLLKVPSAQSPREFNYLINARHPDFHKKVSLVSVDVEPFDPRLKRG